jgi:drug/metabolite transporter (DMT)-like permease
VTAHLTSEHLTPLLVAMVIGAGAVHATWNAIAATISDRLMGFTLIGVAATVGGLVMVLLAGLPASAALPYVIASAIIHVGYELALWNSYRIGAFNQTYPIARGISPLVVALGAYLIAGERLAGLPLAGVVVLAAGLMSLALSSGKLARKDAPAVGAAVLTGLTIASYTIVDGLGVRAAHNPFGYTGLLFLLQGPAFPVIALFCRPASALKDLRVVGRGLLAGVLSMVAYGAVLWAQVRAPLAEVAAVRETSVVFAALIGMIFLRETFGARRVAASILIAAGIIMIAV